ncbi:AraC family transcriptional regulator [Roseospira goensis]|uniref:HTH araC/xylS-type domain-containing protein n=1 Tax=Roseospira goensis TaxID=391922 RepID=A0A7W6WJ38_9PROT|nr:AraC family transcriptional regulator [Roseospira goensis]MBB4284309.1 hypothetical protein [Roseospira goensis]
MAETKTRGAWLYRRWAGLELGRPDGGARGIGRAHFHDEVQIAVVTRGCRSFEVAGAPVDVPAGAMLVVPARVAHRDRGGRAGETGDWAGFNLYLPTGAIGAEPEDVLVAPLPDGLIGCAGGPGRAIDASGLLAHAMANGRIGLRQPACGAPDSGTEAARSAAWHIRRTKRATGITPYAAEVTARANRARRMLCAGHAPADVAAALGFADQAHLTRQFRLCFGTTPAAYRRAMVA